MHIRRGASGNHLRGNVFTHVNTWGGVDAAKRLRREDGGGVRAKPMVRRMFVEHEKNTFFSLLANTRSEDGGQGRAHFARYRSAAQTLEGHRSGGCLALART